ncbi:hypothetical protein GGR22_001026 [Flavobacterium gossypii]|uniref:GLPGLI family protein n=1 Tax=Flavobacterium gossypii TaxID=1646119 RepID=A0ABR6DMI8_9FLAO|nr:hypothetical protein [Flavobacterium gossypii]MBA9072900.1 hypothetical protein [Flavobacterium gossypii]
MNFKSILFLSLSFASQIGFAQTVNYESNNRRVESNIVTYDTKPQGSQYIDETFLPGSYQNNSQIILLRYNAFTDQIEFKDSDDATKNLIPNKGVPIVTTSKKNTYVYEDYTTQKEGNKTGYLNLISENGQVKIYSRTKVFLKEAVAASSGYQTAKPAMYKKATTEYYIKVKEQPIVFIPSNKKELYKLFPGKEKEVTEYIKSNKISLDKEEDLKSLGSFLNTIL